MDNNGVKPLSLEEIKQACQITEKGDENAAEAFYLVTVINILPVQMNKFYRAAAVVVVVLVCNQRP